jgi:hypothetical protein
MSGDDAVSLGQEAQETRPMKCVDRLAPVRASLVVLLLPLFAYA